MTAKQPRKPRQTVAPDVPVRQPRRGTSSTTTKAGRPGRKGGDRTSEQARLEALARRRTVVDLRMAGVTFEQIAATPVPCETHKPKADPTCGSCGTLFADKSGALRSWREAMADVVRPVAQEAYDLELLRYDRALQAIWPKVLAGNLAAVDRMVLISRERRRMAGLDAAVHLHVTSDEAAAEAAQVAAELVAIIRSGELPVDPPLA